jgi:hypothetical protein
MAKKRNKERRKDVCAICGSTEDITREHVPPRALFNEPRPPNTITVPTCKKCNQGSHLDDEYFRVFISAMAIPENEPLMGLWKQKVVKSSFSRSPALVRKLNKDAQEVRDQHKTDPLLTTNGRPLPDEYLDRILSFDMERINRVSEKIARCLFFHHFKRVMPKSSRMETYREHDDNVKFEVILNKAGMVGGEEGEFVYAYKLSQDCIEWFLLFYLQTLMVVKVSIIEARG